MLGLSEPGQATVDVSRAVYPFASTLCYVYISDSRLGSSVCYSLARFHNCVCKEAHESWLDNMLLNMNICFEVCYIHEIS